VSSIVDDDQSRRAEHRDELLPLDVVRSSFAALVTGVHPLSVDGHRFPELPDRLLTLDVVRDLLLDARVSGRARDAVWTHLVLRSRTEPDPWVVACAGMALPALASTASRLAARFAGVERADIHAAVLAGFTEALGRIGLRKPNVEGRLNWAAHRAGRAEIQSALDAPTPSARLFRSTAPHPPWGHPDLVLARAVAAGVLTESEAALIVETRLEEQSLAAWAHTRRVSLETVYKISKRAEARLVAYLDTLDDHPAPRREVATTRPVARVGALGGDPRRLWGPGAAMLAAAVADKTITLVEAELILATRRDEMSLTRWAASKASTLREAFLLRSRAEERLAAHGHIGRSENGRPAAKALFTAPQRPQRGPSDPASKRSSLRDLSRNDPKPGYLVCGDSTSTSRPDTPGEEPQCA